MVAESENARAAVARDTKVGRWAIAGGNVYGAAEHLRLDQKKTGCRISDS